jgi:dihydroorotase
MYTLTDLLGDKLQPHLFCKPVLKNDEDRTALRGAATSGKKCFFLGSDSAPWSKDKKECASGCAGVWNAPVLIPVMFEIFEEMESLPLLENFTSTFGDLFYNKPHVDRQLVVEKSPWILVNPEIHGMVSFCGDRHMGWRVMD